MVTKREAISLRKEVEGIVIYRSPIKHRLWASIRRHKNRLKFLLVGGGGPCHCSAFLAIRPTNPASAFVCYLIEAGLGCHILQLISRLAIFGLGTERS